MKNIKISKLGEVITILQFDIYVDTSDNDLLFYWENNKEHPITDNDFEYIVSDITGLNIILTNDDGEEEKLYDFDGNTYDFVEAIVKLV